MCDHRIKDLTPLRKLKKLTYLNLSQNQISDIRPLTSEQQEGRNRKPKQWSSEIASAESHCCVGLF